MKKIACLILLLIGIVSCGNYNENHTGPTGEVRQDLEVMYQKQLRFYNIYHDGEWHEFVFNAGLYEGGMAHWPGCKFCKEKNKTTK